MLPSTCIYGDHEAENRTTWGLKRIWMSPTTVCRGAFQSSPSWPDLPRVWKRRRYDLGPSWGDRQAHVDGRRAERAAWQDRHADPWVGLIGALPLRTPHPTWSQQQTQALTGVCLTLGQVCWAGSRSQASQHLYLSTDWHPAISVSPSSAWIWGWGGGSPCSLLGGSAEALWTRMQMHQGNCRQALPAKPFLLLTGSADAGPVHKHSIHARTWTQQHLKHKPEQTALICLNPKCSQIRNFCFWNCW